MSREGLLLLSRRVEWGQIGPSEKERKAEEEEEE